MTDAGNAFRAWLLAVNRDYDEALKVARRVTRSYDELAASADNPAYNAAAVVVVCSVIEQPLLAQDWMERIHSFPGARSFWGVQLLNGCVQATNGDHAASASTCLAVKQRLNRATRDEFPDMLVAAALLAQQAGEIDLARRWLTTIRNSDLPIQMFHNMCIYRQLYRQIGFAEDLDSEQSGYEQIRDAVSRWLQAQAESPAAQGPSE